MPTALAARRCPCSTTDDPGIGNALAEFGRLRPRLLGVAHRIVGSRGEAEDVVQDVWLRWQTCDRNVVRNPTAFLVTATTRLAINVSTSARARRETSVGDWTTEPVDASASAAIEAERREAMQLAIRVALQRLAPTERAAYVLRHAFDYPYPRIAALLQISEDNARQLVSRAGKHIAVARPVRPAQPSTATQQRLAHAFRAAAQRGDLRLLEAELTTSVTTPVSSRRPHRHRTPSRPHRHNEQRSPR